MEQAVAAVLPRLLEDIFSIDQIMSLILGEFVRTIYHHGRPELIANILFEICRYYESCSNITEVINWICLCLKNFVQMEPFSYCVWAISCLFISVSNSSLLVGLFHDIAKDSDNYDEEVFIFSALNFYSLPQLTPDTRDSFLSTFNASSFPIFHKVAALCVSSDHK